MAIGLELHARGHQVAIVSSAVHGERVAAAGLEFHAASPSLSPDDKELLRESMDAAKGPERVIRGIMMPALRQSYADLKTAVESHGGADLLVTGEIAYAGPILAEQTGIKWASTVLAPISFFSRFDPPVLSAVFGVSWVQQHAPLVLNRALMAIGRRVTAGWAEPVHELRRELGLKPAPSPIFEGKHGRDLVLALFSRELGAPQPDWPPHTVITGFSFYDRWAPDAGLPRSLQDFLEKGPPPIVFTLGSAAVFDAGRFYLESAEAAVRIGRRAVLLIGFDPENVPPAPLPDDIIAVEYAPFSELFPRAAAIVHQGGVGTTGQVLRSGRPALVMPYSHDQPDNAARAVRLGIARTIDRHRYRASRAASELGRLLEEPGYTKRAAEVADRVRREDGARTAADALERVL